MRIVTWNMNHWSRSAEARAAAWNFLRDDLHADVALLQETVPPPDVDAVYKPIDADHPRYNWGSAVVTLSSTYRLRARTRCSLHAPSTAGELAESHPGTAAVADVIDVATGEPRIVAVSFYGAWEYFPADPAKPKQAGHLQRDDRAPHRVRSVSAAGGTRTGAAQGPRGPGR